MSPGPALPTPPTPEDVLLSLSLPGGYSDLVWLSKRLQAPLAPGPLRRFFGPASLQRALLGMLRQGAISPYLDLRRPLAAALVDLPGPKLRPADQWVLSVEVNDLPGFLGALNRRYGQGREEAGVHHFASGVALRALGRRVTIAATPQLLAGAKAILSPLLLAKKAAKGAQLVFWVRRIRQRFGASVGPALRWMRLTRFSGRLAWLEPLRPSAWALVDALWAGRVARLSLAFKAQRIVISGGIEGGTQRGAGLVVAQARLWGAELLGEGASAAYFRAGLGSWGEVLLGQVQSFLGVAQGAKVERSFRALGAQLRGPSLGALYGTKAGSMGVLWAARVEDVSAARRAQDQVSGALVRAVTRAVTRAWPLLRGRSPVARGLRRPPRLRHRPLRLSSGVGGALGTRLFWHKHLRPPAARWRAGWDAWWGRARPELAHAVVAMPHVAGAPGGVFLFALGPDAVAQVVAAARRAKTGRKTGPFLQRWSPQLGSRLVRMAWHVSLTRLMEQILPLMARRRDVSLQWSALIRQILPPVGANGPAAISGWMGVAETRSEGTQLRFSTAVSADVLGWVTKVGLLLFRVGSYGRRGTP